MARKRSQSASSAEDRPRKRKASKPASEDDVGESNSVDSDDEADRPSGRERSRQQDVFMSLPLHPKERLAMRQLHRRVGHGFYEHMNGLTAPAPLPPSDAEDEEVEDDMSLDDEYDVPDDPPQFLPEEIEKFKPLPEYFQDTSAEWQSKCLKARDKFDAATFNKGPDQNLLPMSEIPEIFADMVKNAMKKLPKLKLAAKHLENRTLRVATMCSGTESPVIALKALFANLGKEAGLKSHPKIEHLFSAEIVPYKQAFIELNFSPQIIFRDIVEMGTSLDGKATTAFGAKKTIPGKIDLLVAGFSCVDMSNLNNRKLTLQEKGESGDTLQATLAYAEKYRPNIVVLENLDGAPWEPKKGSRKTGKTISEMWFNIGYYCQSVRIDTKHYYIPHTRCRGYMVCVDNNRLSRNPFVNTVSKKFVAAEKLLEVEIFKLKRDASEPVEAFLLPENDPRVVRSSAGNTHLGALRAVDWGTCEAKHMTYRYMQRLGLQKPLTHWTLGGNCRPHDSLVYAWVHNSVERVKDSIDIMYLRNLRRGFDPFYKNRMIDLSQNVDRRSVDASASGYTGCVTPNGIMFSTALGRVLIAEEALKLQGMDPDTLNVSLLTQSQLQDLAGNAMSCPTVGAVILAGLSMTYMALEQKDAEKTVQKIERVDTIEDLAKKGGPHDIKLGSLEDFDVTTCLDKIARCLQHCACEGSFGFPTTKLVECLDCGHKACTKHSANPVHNYEVVTPDREDPREALKLFRSWLPSSLCFSCDLKDVTEDLESAVANFCGKSKSQPRPSSPLKSSPPAKLSSKSKSQPRSSSTLKSGPDAKLSSNPKLLQTTLKDVFLTAPSPSPARTMLKSAKPSTIYWEDLKQILDKLDGSQAHLKNIERTDRHFKCTFESSGNDVGALRIELILNGRGMEWKVFAKTPSNQAVNSPLRAILDHPIARMRPEIQQKNIMNGNWEFRVPSAKTDKFKVVIQGVGQCIPCYEYTRGLASFEDVTIWDALEITTQSRSPIIDGYSINGRYTLHQECGTAMGILYKKAGTKVGDQPIYLVLDPSRYGHPDEDSFVFSTDCSRLKFKEARSTIARLDKTWRPNSACQDMSDRPTDYVDEETGKTKHLTHAGTNYVYQPATPLTVRCFVDSTWKGMTASLDTKAHGTYSCISRVRDLSLAPEFCHAAIEVLNVDVVAQNLGLSGGMMVWETVPVKDCSKFLRNLVWLLQRTPLVSNIESLSEEWHSVSPSSQDCSCYQNPPAIKWRLQERKWASAEVAKARSSKFRNIPESSRDKVLVAYEDPEESVEYEKALKGRPSPFVVQYQMKGNDSFGLKIGVNPLTLMHRAAGLFGEPSQNAQIQLCYRLSTSFDPNYKIPLKPFRILDNELNEEAPNPPHFRLDLHSHQARSLAWMISQEDNVPAFEEERVVEAAMNGLKCRVEGRASRRVVTRGGILADQVGYGKTPLVLGLFDSQHGKQPADPPEMKCRISIKATLILVPSHLLDQWAAETMKFVDLRGAGYNMLVIKDESEWKKTPVSRFKKADLIICPWTLLEHDMYLGRVGDLGGMLAYPRDAGIRAERAWYTAARETVREMTGYAQDPDMPLQNLHERLTRKLQKHCLEAKANSSTKPSARFRGAAYQAQKKMAGKEKVKADVEIDVGKEWMDYDREDSLGLKKLKSFDELCGPPLEIFNFRRKAVDEYTYAEGQLGDTLANISSQYSWFLSGTPGLIDFVDAWKLMKFLGIDLGQPELTPGIIRIQNIKAMSAEQTQSEQFRALLNVPSFAWSMGRHEYAQKAVNAYVRQNFTPVRECKVYNHIRPVTLPAIDRAIYSELTLTVAGSNMREKPPMGCMASIDRQKRLKWIWKKDPAVKLPVSAVGALMKCNMVNKLVDLDELLKVRRKELELAKKMVGEQFKTLWYLRRMEVLKPPPKRITNEIKIDFYEEFVDRMKRNETADPEVCSFILSEIKRYENVPKGLEHRDPEDFRVQGLKALPTLRSLCNTLRTQCKILVSAHRSYRFLVSVFVLRGASKTKAQGKVIQMMPGIFKQNDFPKNIKQKEIWGCDHDNCSAEGVSVECGHLYCLACVEKMEETGNYSCRKQWCTPPAGYPYFNRKELFQLPDLERANAKMKKIIDLIECIPEHEQVLLFTQFPDQLTQIVKCLKAGGVSFAVLETAKDNKVGQILTDFQNTKNKQVLVLNIDNVSAAGSNLTAANHVIFVFPYLAPSQVKHDSSMTQAIGRVCREGQKKDIHVYHFLTLQTADVDVFEARRKAVLCDQSDPPNAPEHLSGEWDHNKKPNLQGWKPSGLHLVDRRQNCMAFDADKDLDSEDQVVPITRGGKFSSDIHQKVVSCMDHSLYDDDDVAPAFEEAEEGDEDERDEVYHDDDD